MPSNQIHANTPSALNTLISLNNVTLTLTGQKIIRHVNLDIHRGEIVTIIGPNGAGKSSLIKILAGLLKPSSGNVNQHSQINIGYVPQKLFMDRSMPLKVSRFLSLTQVPKNQYRSALERVNATSLWKKQMHALSGGEFQRVLLARAIAKQPDVLLLDEPLQGVDISGQHELYRLIAELRDELNCGVVMISHDLHLVMAQTDRVICFNQHICCEGKPEAISAHPEYLNLFGPISAESVAVYAHHHDHHHNLHGDVEHCNNHCSHD